MDNKIRKSIDIDKDLFQKLQIQAVYEGMSVKMYIEQIVKTSVYKNTTRSVGNYKKQ